MKNINNTNLFSIDYDIVKSTLLQANEALINKVNDYLKQSANYTTLDNNLAAEELKEYLIGLRSLAREVSSARLSDGRPFTDAVKVIQEWFGVTEAKLKEQDRKLSRLLSKYTSDLSKTLKEKSNIEVDRKNETDSHPMASVASSTGVREIIRNEPPALPNVKMVWQVKSFDRAGLDIEKLRPYLTDHSIKMAINSYIKDIGPNSIDGVEFEQVIAKSL